MLWQKEPYNVFYDNNHNNSSNNNNKKDIRKCQPPFSEAWNGFVCMLNQKHEYKKYECEFCTKGPFKVVHGNLWYFRHWYHLPYHIIRRNQCGCNPIKWFFFLSWRCAVQCTFLTHSYSAIVMCGNAWYGYFFEVARLTVTSCLSLPIITVTNAFSRCELKRRSPSSSDREMHAKSWIEKAFFLYLFLNPPAVTSGALLWHFNAIYDCLFGYDCCAFIQEPDFLLEGVYCIIYILPIRQ